MEHRELGTTGLRVPVIGMGTWRTFDVHEPGPERARREVVDVALANGANFFDSSPMYGAAERVLGAALQGRRDQAMVATKVWASTPAEGRAQAERALGFFGGKLTCTRCTTCWPGRQLALLEELARRQVRAIGATHYSPRAFGELRRSCAPAGSARSRCRTTRWSARSRREILPLAAELGLGVVVMRPFGEAPGQAPPAAGTSSRCARSA